MAALKRCGGLIARFSVKWSPVYFASPWASALPFLLQSSTQQLHLSATSRYREWKDWSGVNWIYNMLRFLQPFVGTKLKTTLMWIKPITASATIQQWLMNIVARVEHDSRRRLGHQLVRPTLWRRPNLYLWPCALLASASKCLWFFCWS